MGQKKILGVLGNPVAHSKSPELFDSLFKNDPLQNWEYHKFEFSDLETFFKELQNNVSICGFNVTIPHKSTIIDKLDDLDEIARRIGAVNTVLVKRNGHQIYLTGYNTDYYGFYESMLEIGTKFEQALILGTGGASKAVSAVLEDLQIPFKLASRNPKVPLQIGYENVGEIISKSHTLLVNTTPVGMLNYPEQFFNIDFESMAEDLKVIDLVYNPPITPLMAKCLQKDITCINGWIMLKKQAEKAWEYFKTANEN